MDIVQGGRAINWDCTKETALTSSASLNYLEFSLSRTTNRADQYFLHYTGLSHLKASRPKQKTQAAKGQSELAALISFVPFVHWTCLG